MCQWLILVHEFFKSNDLKSINMEFSFSINEKKMKIINSEFREDSILVEELR